MGRSLAAWSSSRNSERKIGICSRIGRHDANGFVPVSLYSAMVSWARRSRSWPYFFCSSLTFGCSSCMFRLDLICRTNSGIRAARITSVRPTIDSAQDHPDSGPKIPPNNEWKPVRITEVIQYSGAMMKLPIAPRKSNTQAP